MGIESLRRKMMMACQLPLVFTFSDKDPFFIAIPREGVSPWFESKRIGAKVMHIKANTF